MGQDAKRLKIAITGGNGFIGTNLIERLVNEGHEVHSLDNLATGYKENEIKGCTYHYFDIEKISMWNGEDIDLCFHLAGLSRIQPSFEDPTETFRVNTAGCQTVAEWARLYNIKIVYAGSSSKHHNPYQSPYACCKYLGEEIFKMYRHTYDMDIEIARFYNVYGPKEPIDGDWAAVTGIWRRQIRDKQPLTIVGDGKQRRDFTHVDDIVHALIKIGLENNKHEDAWELGTGINYSINEVAQMFVQRFKCRIKHIPDQKGNYRETLRENNDSVELLGWSPKDKLKDYILNL
jgi:UDP-glucose 4-epimerase